MPRSESRVTATIEQEGPWFIAYCKEVPGANGQGRTREECLTSLHQAILLMQAFHSEESEKLPR
ncbi:MAG: type II toxin-antitoxin system HicB family antitoxin [Acidobacteria bacterium]|nr:type II toxin-antitoxin system HicB family antitoxin [Acidobacteriota bacterium]